MKEIFIIDRIHDLFNEITFLLQNPMERINFYRRAKLSRKTNLTPP